MPQAAPTPTQGTARRAESCGVRPAADRGEVNDFNQLDAWGVWHGSCSCGRHHGKLDMKARSATAGFTLVEVLIVVAILAVTAALGWLNGRPATARSPLAGMREAALHGAGG